MGILGPEAKYFKIKNPLGNKLENWGVGKAHLHGRKAFARLTSSLRDDYIDRYSQGKEALWPIRY
jgi:hypothetical protein